MKAIIAVPRYFNLFPSPFDLPHFLLLVMIEISTQFFTLSLKPAEPNPNHQLDWSLIVGATVPVVTAPALVIMGSK